MVANPERRRAIVDGALSVLGSAGARGLSHRAVDRRCALPLGTTANYFPSRGELVHAAAERIFERLTPDPERVRTIRATWSGRAAVEEFMVDLVRRLADAPELASALYELRLESGRSPEVAAVLHPFLAQGFEEDVRFHVEAGLPGGRAAVGVLHQAIDGLMLELVSGQRGREGLDEATRELVRRLLTTG